MSWRLQNRLLIESGKGVKLQNGKSFEQTLNDAKVQELKTFGESILQEDGTVHPKTLEQVPCAVVCEQLHRDQNS